MNAGVQVAQSQRYTLGVAADCGTEDGHCLAGQADRHTGRWQHAGRAGVAGVDPYLQCADDRTGHADRGQSRVCPGDSQHQ